MNIDGNCIRTADALPLYLPSMTSPGCVAESGRPSGATNCPLCLQHLGWGGLVPRRPVAAAMFIHICAETGSCGTPSPRDYANPSLNWASGETLFGGESGTTGAASRSPAVRLPSGHTPPRGCSGRRHRGAPLCYGGTLVPPDGLAVVLGHAQPRTCAAKNSRYVSPGFTPRRPSLSVPAAAERCIVSPGFTPRRPSLSGGRRRRERETIGAKELDRPARRPRGRRVRKGVGLGGLTVA